MTRFNSIGLNPAAFFEWPQTKEIVNLQPLSQVHAWKAFLVPKLHQLIELHSKQGVSLVARLTFGFLCVRLLPVSEYAKFAVVFGFVGTLALLMDIGFSGSLLPLIGEQVDDHQLIADYAASLRQLAHWLFLLMAPVAIVLYPLLVRKQHWSWRVVAGMIAILLVVAWCDRISGTYGSVLIVLRDRKAWYRAQMIASLGALALLGVIWALHAVNAFSAILISVASVIFISFSYYLRARSRLGVLGHTSKEKRKAIIHLALPIIPNVFFYAVQGQVSLILITLFGRTAAVAGVGALSRLAQIFVLFGQAGPLLIEPYFARLPEARLKRNYLLLIAVVGTFCVLITGLAGFCPQLFLWVLGRNYSSLRFEVFLMIAGSSIAYCSGLLWVIHAGRRFVYWWNSIAIIVLTLAVQAWFIWKVDLSTVRAVLMLSLVIAAVNLLVNALTGIYGFVFGPRKTAILIPVPAGEDLV